MLKGLKVGDWVKVTISKVDYHGKIVRYDDINQKFTINFFDPAKGKYRTVLKSVGDCLPGGIGCEWTRRRERNFNLLKDQDAGLLPLATMVGDSNWDKAIAALAVTDEVGLDIETFGYEDSRDALHPLTGDIRFIQVYVPKVDLCLIWDLGEILDRNSALQNKNGFYDWDLLPGGKILKSVLTNPLVSKYIHNAAFEGLWFSHCFNIDLFNIVDSMLLSQIYWAGLSRGMQAIGIDSPNSLKWVAFRLNLGVPDKQDQLWDYGFAVGDRQFNYGATDAKLCYLAGKELFKRGRGLNMELPMCAELLAIPAFSDMRYKGIPIRSKVLYQYLETYTEVYSRLCSEWEAEFPGISPSSGKQSSEAILERYDVDIMTISKTTGLQTPSIAYDVLSPYFESYPILRTLASINSVVKGIEYLTRIQETMRANFMGMPSCFGDFRQLAAPASMGRSGCGGKDRYIQLQTPPKGTTEWRNLGLPRLRSVFGVPDKGDLEFFYDLIGEQIPDHLLQDEYVFGSYDLSGSHGYIAGWCSQEPKIQEALDSGVKIHYYTSQGILQLDGINLSPLEIKTIHKEDPSHVHYNRICEVYEFAKTAFYTSLNGGGGTRLQSSFQDSDPPQFIPLETCNALMKGTKQAYPTMFQYMYSLPAQAAMENHMIPVWFSATGDPIYWGYYQGYEANKKGWIVPPGATDKPRWVGQNKGKYSGNLPGSIRMYGSLRSPDNARYFLQREPDKKGRYVCLLGDSTAFVWQSMERTGIKKAAGIIKEKFAANPEWGAWLPSFLHDELIFVCKKEYQLEVATLFCDTILACMRELVPYFPTEVKDPLSIVGKFWKK